MKHKPINPPDASSDSVLRSLSEVDAYSEGYRAGREDAHRGVYDVLSAVILENAWVRTAVLEAASDIDIATAKRLATLVLDDKCTSVRETAQAIIAMTEGDRRQLTMRRYTHARIT